MWNRRRVLAAMAAGGAALKAGAVSAQADGHVESMPAPTLAESNQIAADGVWTWYNDPRVLDIDGVTYAGGVQSDGDVCITKTTAAGVSSSFTLCSQLEIDDHNNPAFCVLPGGRLFTGYAKHGADNFLRYRVSANPLPDISAFDPEVALDNGARVTYAQPYLLSDGYLRVFYRSSTSGARRPRKMLKAPAADVESGVATWATTTIVDAVNQRPYAQLCQNGPDRIDWFITNGHPNEVVTSLYHFYMQLNGGAEEYFASDGTPLTLPIKPNSGPTLIQNARGGRCWNWQIGIGADGHPRVLATRYPSSTGARDSIFTDIEYWHYRWTGAAWTGFPMFRKQVSLYAEENHYAGGICFHGADPARIFVSLTPSASAADYRVEEWSIDEDAQHISKLRDMQASNQPQIRPYSPPGSTKVMWVEGAYPTFRTYRTRQMIM